MRLGSLCDFNKGAKLRQAHYRPSTKDLLDLTHILPKITQRLLQPQRDPSLAEMSSKNYKVHSFGWCQNIPSLPHLLEASRESQKHDPNHEQGDQRRGV